MDDVAVHPGSVISGSEASVTERHIVMYERLLQTSRTFAVNLTPLPALPCLLLYAQQVDTDVSGTHRLCRFHVRTYPGIIGVRKPWCSED